MALWAGGSPKPILFSAHRSLRGPQLPDYKPKRDDIWPALILRRAGTKLRAKPSAVDVRRLVGESKTQIGHPAAKRVCKRKPHPFRGTDELVPLVAKKREALRKALQVCQKKTGVGNFRTPSPLAKAPRFHALRKSAGPWKRPGAPLGSGRCRGSAGWTCATRKSIRSG